MRSRVRVTAAFAASLAASVAALSVAAPAFAATRKPVQVARSASGTVIQPTMTIIPDGRGHARVIVVHPRSYLDTGTEVSVGDRKFRDYVELPGGDPGHPNWFFGPDVQGRGHYPLPGALDGFGSISPY